MSLDVQSTEMSAVASSAPARRSLWGRLYHGETAIDFYGRRRWGLIISGALLVISVASLAIQQLNLGIDFKGGVAWEVAADTLSVEQAQQVLEDEGVRTEGSKIQERSNADGRNLLIQVGDQTVETQEQVRTALAVAAGVDVSQVSSSQISSTWGRTITEKALRALVTFLVLVAIVISLRFEWRMAAGAIAAMVHDVLISVGIYSLFGFEVTPATVVAFLTILGFSLYDTIVVFDKVNENTARFANARMPYGDIVNVSMNQVLMRSLNTSLAAVLPVLSLLVLGSWIMGAVSLREFALALLVGLITGSYSSIFIATPALAWLKDRQPAFKPLRNAHATGAELERLVLGGAPVGRREALRRRARRDDEAATDGHIDVTTVHSDQDAAALLSHPPRPRKKSRR
jgi:preprotein translocase subunit SecF